MHPLSFRGKKCPDFILYKSITEFIQVIGVFILRNSYNLIMSFMNKHRSASIKDAECAEPSKFAKKRKKTFHLTRIFSGTTVHWIVTTMPRFNYLCKRETCAFSFFGNNCILSEREIVEIFYLFTKCLHNGECVNCVY